MASAELPVEPAVKLALDALKSLGFYAQDDPGIGERISGPASISTEDGLQFYVENFLQHEVGIVWIFSTDPC